MIDLLTTIYPIRSVQRLAEICLCLENNIALDSVDHVYVLAENFDRSSSIYNFLKHPKVTLIDIDHRPTYHDFFSFANANLIGRYVTICNSDVYFDETLEPALESLKPDCLWCLCRHNLHEDGTLELQGNGDGGSADAWLFRAPLRPFHNDIVVGVLGCDSYLAQKAAEAGIGLCNPCHDVILRHVHRDPERNDNPGGMTYWSRPDNRSVRVQPSTVAGTPIGVGASFMSGSNMHRMMSSVNVGGVGVIASAPASLDLSDEGIIGIVSAKASALQYEYPEVEACPPPSQQREVILTGHHYPETRSAPPQPEQKEASPTETGFSRHMFPPPPSASRR